MCFGQVEGVTGRGDEAPLCQLTVSISYLDVSNNSHELVRIYSLVSPTTSQISSRQASERETDKRASWPSPIFPSLYLVSNLPPSTSSSADGPAQ